MTANNIVHFWALLSTGSWYNLIISMLGFQAIRARSEPHFVANFGVFSVKFKAQMEGTCFYIQFKI